MPEYDPGQVKSGLAELFRIKDPGVLEEMFSGDAFVLRSNLDRKSAADYFRKITQLGGKAELVVRRGDDADSGRGETFRRVQAIDSGSMAVRRKHSASLDMDETLEVTPARPSGPSDEEVLARLQQLMQEAEERHRAELELIDRQQAAEEDKTARSLQQLQQQHAAVLDNANAELKRLAALEQSTLAQFQSNVELVHEEREERRRQLEQRLEELATRRRKHIAAAEQSLKDLQDRKASVQAEAEAAIAQLESLIDETRKQAQADTAELDTLLDEAHVRQEHELGALDNEVASLTSTTEQDILSLSLREEDYQELRDREVDEIRGLREHAEVSRDDALHALQDQERTLFRTEQERLEEFKRARQRQRALLQQRLDRLRLEEEKIRHGGREAS